MSHWQTNVNRVMKATCLAGVFQDRLCCYLFIYLFAKNIYGYEQIVILELFLKDHVTLKTGVMMLKIPF